MNREIYLIDDKKVAKAIIAATKKLKLSITDDIKEAQVGNYLTLGSKNFILNWIRNESFALKKAKAANITIKTLNAYAEEMFTSIMEEYDRVNPMGTGCITEVPDIVVDPAPKAKKKSNKKSNGPDSSTVIMAYNNIKRMRKSPKNYYFYLKDNVWTASSNRNLVDTSTDTVYDMYQRIN